MPTVKEGLLARDSWGAFSVIKAVRPALSGDRSVKQMLLGTVLVGVCAVFGAHLQTGIPAQPTPSLLLPALNQAMRCGTHRVSVNRRASQTPIKDECVLVTWTRRML